MTEGSGSDLEFHFSSSFTLARNTLDFTELEVGSPASQLFLPFGLAHIATGFSFTDPLDSMSRRTAQWEHDVGWVFLLSLLFLARGADKGPWSCVFLVHSETEVHVTRERERERERERQTETETVRQRHRDRQTNICVLAYYSIVHIDS